MMIRSPFAMGLVATLAVSGCSSSPVAAEAVDASSPDADTVDAGAGSTDAALVPFVLTSPAFASGGAMAAEYTCDGVGHSPALAWSGAPSGTAEFAVLMTTIARDGLKWSWVLYGISASTTGLAAGSTGVGTAGLTSDGPNLAYSPPCSQGPGAKDYTFTVYALSAKPTLPAQASLVTGTALTDAIASLTLAQSALTVTYTRP